MEYINAKVTNTQLGCLHDRGIMTFWIHLEFGIGGKGFGGYCLDSWDSDNNERVQSKLTGDMIYGILQALDLDSWEDLKGKYVRVAVDEKGFGQKLLGIGHIVNDKFFMIEDWLANYKDSK